MRYRFIVFRAQPTKETIALSIYVEVISSQTPGDSRTLSAKPSPLTSPVDEYALADGSIFSLPTAVTARNPLKQQQQQQPQQQPRGQHRREESACRTVERNWEQCEWLHQRIVTNFRLQALPPFPDRISLKRLTDPLYVERQRVRIERWLNRLGSREDICNSGSVDRFVSPTRMADDEVASSAKTSFSSILRSLFSGSSERGFRVYTPIGDIEDFDEDEEERRRDYINRTEECTSELAESIKNMHAQEDLLGKSIVKVATAISKAYREDSVNLLASNEGGASGSATPLPQPTDNERLRVSLALLHSSSEAYYWSTKEMSLWKEYHLVDAMTEFGTMVDGVKDVINHSTQMLVLYEKTMQMHQSYESRANSLRVQYPSDTPSVKYANEQEVQAGREKELAHQEYTDACDMANKEMIRYERERAQGMCKALEETAKVELECARARCLELRAVCRRIRGIQLVKDPPHPRTNIGPMLWHAASMHPSMLSPNSSTPGASSSSMSTAFARTASPERSATFSDRLGAGSLASSKSAHRHSNSSGGPKLCGDFLHDTQHLASIRRAHTMDNADFAPSASNHGAGPSSAERNHSVFMETNEDDDLLLRHQHSFSATTSAAAPEPFSLSSHSSLVLLSPPKWQHAGADSRASQPRQARWNGRVSALPFQGYDPPPHSSKAPHHIVVDQSRLAEMAAEAEMEAELVRSGMLAPRKSKISLGSAAASNGGGSGGILTPNTSKRQQQQQPLALAAFRPSPLPSPSPTPSPSNSRLRQTSSHADLSAISQPVSASEYLQYSRQTLHTSLSQQASQKHLRPSSSSSGIGSSTSRGKSGPASTAAGSSRSAVAVRAHQRRDKGKARAFAV